MSNYERTFKSSTWSTSAFEKLTHTEKIFYFLLTTGEETSDTSVYPLSVSRICYHLGITPEKTLELIDSFQKKGLIDYDFDTEEVLVLCYFIHNPPRGGIKYEGYSKDLNKIKSQRLMNHLAEVAKSYPITIGFFAALKEHVNINQSDYKIKSTTQTAESAKSAAQKGREKIAENRRNANELPEDLGNESPFPRELPEDLPY